MMHIQINPFDVIFKVESLYHLNKNTLCGKRRTRTVSEARAIAMWCVKQLTSYSYPEIADHFNKDHSSVIHNCKKIAKIVSNDKYSHIKNVIINVLNEFNTDQKVSLCKTC